MHGTVGCHTSSPTDHHCEPDTEHMHGDHGCHSATPLDHHGGTTDADCDGDNHDHDDNGCHAAAESHCETGETDVHDNGCHRQSPVPVQTGDDDDEPTQGASLPPDPLECAESGDHSHPSNLSCHPRTESHCQHGEHEHLGDEEWIGCHPRYDVHTGTVSTYFYRSLVSLICYRGGWFSPSLLTGCTAALTHDLECVDSDHAHPGNIICHTNTAGSDHHCSTGDHAHDAPVSSGCHPNIAFGDHHCSAGDHAHRDDIAGLVNLDHGCHPNTAGGNHHCSTGDHAHDAPVSSGCHPNIASGNHHCQLDWHAHIDNVVGGMNLDHGCHRNTYDGNHHCTATEHKHSPAPGTITYGNGQHGCHNVDIDHCPDGQHQHDHGVSECHANTNDGQHHPGFWTSVWNGVKTVVEYACSEPVSTAAFSAVAQAQYTTPPTVGVTLGVAYVGYTATCFVVAVTGITE